MKASVKPPTDPASIPAATVETTATPIEPPTSWKVLTTPEASPASSGSTMPRAVVVAVTKTAPRPTERTSRPCATSSRAEQHRFPEPGRAWQERGPESHHPAVAGALRTLADQGRLVIPDLEAAIFQLYALLVLPRTVISTYGTHIDDDLTDRLIGSGVDMFLAYYGPRPPPDTGK